MNQPCKIYDDIYLVGSSEISHSMDCCVYLVDAGELVLIDTGAGKSTGCILDNIQSLGLMPEKLSTIIVTHAHIDHIGSLFELSQRYSIRILAHEDDSATIESGKRVGEEHYGIKYMPCKVDYKVKGEESLIKIGIYEFLLIHIPGHTPGSLAVMIKIKDTKVLFGQDIHGPYYTMWGGEPKKAINSLIKLRDLRADILCEGHYGIIRPAQDVIEFIQEFIDHLRDQRR